MIRKSDALLIGLVAQPTGSIARFGVPSGTSGLPPPPQDSADLGHHRAEAPRHALRIGLDCSLHWGQARRLISDFRENRPEVELTIADVDEVGAGVSLLDDDLDAAILVQGAVPRGLRSAELWSEHLIAAVPDGHRLAEHNAVVVADLRREEILLAGTARAHAGLQDAIVRALGGTVAFVRQPVTRDTLFDLVALHFGVTIVPGASTGAFYPGVAFRPICPTAHITYQLLWKPDNHNPALHEFTRFVRTAVQPRSHGYER